jgi:sodium/potassium/calcium exchanger 6
MLTSPPLVLFLIVLFRILGSTAEEFFSPGLEMFSLKLGLPERFAGVTLLALGNGAPDVASTVSAIMNDRKRGYLMALGELTGAAMVASTVIVGAVTYVSDGVICRGSLVRDVIVFMLTMVVTYKAFDSGTISVGEIRCFLFMYVAYALIVLGSDIFHKVVVAPRMAREKKARRDKMLKQGSDGAADASLDIEIEPSESTALVASGANGDKVTPIVVPDEGIELGHKDHLKGFRLDPKPIANIERMIEAISNYDVESNDNTSDEEADDEIESGPEPTSLFRARSATITEPPRPKAPPRRHVSDPHPSGWGERDVNGSEPLIVFHPHHGGIVNLKHAHSGSFDHHLHHHQHTNKTSPSPSSTVATEHHECEACLAGDPGPAPESWRDAFIASKDELAGLLRRLWGDTFASDEYSAVEEFFIACEMPFTVLRMVS